MRRAQITKLAFLLVLFCCFSPGQERQDFNIKENLQEFSGEGFNLIRAWMPSSVVKSTIFKKLETKEIINQGSFFSNLINSLFLEEDELRMIPLAIEYSATNDVTGVFTRICGFPGKEKLLKRFKEGYAHYGIEEERVNNFILISVVKPESAEPVPAICLHGELLDCGDQEALVAHYQSQEKESSEVSKLCRESLLLDGRKVMTLDFLEGDSDWARADLFSLLNPPDHSMALFREAEGVRGFCTQSSWDDALVIRKNYYLAKGSNGKALKEFTSENKVSVSENILKNYFGSEEVAKSCLKTMKVDLNAKSENGTFSIILSMK
jgi:hypothetical protein